MRSRRLVTRRRLAELNAQDWADFRAHWPLRLFEVFKAMAGGFAFGFCFGLAVLLFVLKGVSQ